MLKSLYFGEKLNEKFVNFENGNNLLIRAQAQFVAVQRELTGQLRSRYVFNSGA
ncbi:hypothetical protein BDD12DRAFT_832682 [Trichophaea hybrida]|nr:hypothetical protein BDD12DRAFT_832682 [Trichophaea hybrida]